MLRVGFLKERKRLREQNHALIVQNEIFENMIESYRMDDFKNTQTIAQLKVENQALKDALKIATSDREVEPWKIALDDDIEQYILKEGEDGGQKDTRRLLRE